MHTYKKVIRLANVGDIIERKKNQLEVLDSTPLSLITTHQFTSKFSTSALLERGKNQHAQETLFVEK